MTDLDGKRSLDEAFQRILDAEDERLARLESGLHEQLDPDRCEVCRWPLSKDPAGCRPRDCSYRERDGSAEHARLRERREAVDARISGPVIDPKQTALRVVTHDEAREIGRRYHASHWYPRGSRAPFVDGLPIERARYSIPANPERDDDLRLAEYIARAEQVEAELHTLRNKLAAMAARYGGDLKALGLEALPPRDGDHASVEDSENGTAAGALEQREAEQVLVERDRDAPHLNLLELERGAGAARTVGLGHVNLQPRTVAPRKALSQGGTFAQHISSRSPDVVGLAGLLLGQHVAGDACRPGDECGRTGCPECQQ